MKLIDGDDLLEHAEVNGESEEFIRKLDDYIKDAPKMNRQAIEPLTEKQRATLIRMRDQFYVSHNDDRFEAVDAALKILSELREDD